MDGLMGGWMGRWMELWCLTLPPVKAAVLLSKEDFFNVVWETFPTDFTRWIRTSCWLL